MKPFTAEVKQIYDNHGHFHDGDAGLDLFIINEQTIRAGESTLIHLQISCDLYTDFFGESFVRPTGQSILVDGLLLKQ